MSTLKVALLILLFGALCLVGGVKLDQAANSHVFGTFKVIRQSVLNAEKRDVQKGLETCEIIPVTEIPNIYVKVCKSNP